MAKKKTPETPEIHKDMLIGEVVDQFPMATDIMLSYGLHCVGCHANAFETLEQGMLGHGFREEDLNNLLEELNDMANDEGTKVKTKKPSKESENMEMTVTKKALKKIKEIAKDEKKMGWPLKIEGVYAGPKKIKYSMNFVEEGKEYDKDFPFEKGKVVVLMDRRDYHRLNGISVDYVKRKDAEGFKIDNPNILSL